MRISFILNGQRGAQYQISVSQIGHDVGGGLLWEIQQLRTTRGLDKKVVIASNRQDSGDTVSRILAGWLETPMPKLDEQTGDQV